jgi:hypothetical protein
MKTALILLVSLGGLSTAQDRKTEAKRGEVKRSASVTWDLKSHKLVWSVQTGSEW